MAVDLSHNLEKLKHTFNNILILRTDISNIKSLITTKINHLKTVYGELSKNTTKKALLFSLDSFFFQYKLFSVESESIDKLRILLNKPLMFSGLSQDNNCILAPFGKSALNSVS